MTNPALEGRPRNERRFLLAKEERSRKSGNWGQWSVKHFPKGSVSPNPKGWAYQFEIAHVNDVFSVLDRLLENGVRHLAITSLSQVRPSWPEMQRIKDEIAGPNATAVEVYPPQNEIVDDADMYHLWVLTGPLDFSLSDEVA